MTSASAQFCREYAEEQRNERFARETEAFIGNMQTFIASLRECHANAEASPTGRCEAHRHGRMGWEEGR